MNPKIIMFCAFVFGIGSIFCCIYEGGWYGADDVSFWNVLTGYSVASTSDAGGWAVPAQIGRFFTHAIPKLITWDYPFFQGVARLIAWIFLYPVSGGVVYGLAMGAISVVQGLLARR